MALEIERKFLVTGDAWRAVPGTLYRQGYLSRDKGRTVRVRVVEDRAFLTIKGPTTGFSRPEFEYEVPLADAEEMLGLCEGPVVEKRRHHVLHEGYVWEVDEFLGDNAGLVVAEIELPSEGTLFDQPDWIGNEVTADSRYANSRLSVNPYKNWK